MEEHPIDHLYATIVARKSARASKSYTAQLLKRGVAQCAKKLGEEGVEAALAAVGGKKKEIVAESADALYQLPVVGGVTGVQQNAVYVALDARRAQSGLVEKKSRKRK